MKMQREFWKENSSLLLIESNNGIIDIVMLIRHPQRDRQRDWNLDIYSFENGKHINKTFSKESMSTKYRDASNAICMRTP